MDNIKQVIAETQNTEQHINCIIENASKKVIPKHVLIEETCKDTILATLKKIISSNTYDTKSLNTNQKEELKCYLKVKEEIC